MADIHFYFDPVCPFAWLTSRWVHEVVRQRDYDVEWRFISLRMLNETVDYDSQFPTGYKKSHHQGLRLLRVAAAARAEHGPDVVGPLYTAYGTALFDCDQPEDFETHRDALDETDRVAAMLVEADLSPALVSALDDEAFDPVIRTETEEALALTGKDVGTPIIHFQPPGGCAFFGPVISRLPSGDDAVRLWDNVIELAAFPGFAELKRSLREVPRLRAFGLGDEDVGTEEDWHGGSRRLKK